MNKLTRVFLCLLGLTAVLVPYYSTTARDDKKDDGKEVLAIEILLNSKKPLTVPITGKKSAIVPLTGAEISAVKIVSWAEGNLIRFDVLAVLDPLPEERSCANLKQLKTALVTSHSGRLGEVIRVSSLEKFGVAPFNVSVMKRNPVSLGCPSSCCCCGNLQCCPKKASCITCGDCGTCCSE